MEAYKQNNDYTYVRNKYAEKNTFIGSDEKPVTPPEYDVIRTSLPRPVFDGHPDYLKCYDYAWRKAFSNLHKPKEGTGFVSSYIDAAFNGCLFMWDSIFMMMFGKYGDRVFPFQRTLDNMYALQHRDGFISREIQEETGRETFARHDPSSTGPNLLAWCELMYYENVNDYERLKRVYNPLRAFHDWYRENRTWRDGTYFSSGWGCGMDNIPRFETDSSYDFDDRCQFSHNHMVWIDICLEAILDCDCLIKMNEILGGEDDVSDLIEEKKHLTDIVNNTLWDDGEAFYFDQYRDGRLNHVKHIGAYWALTADVVPEDRLERFIAHLKNEKEFRRPTPVPTLSADHPLYQKTGAYWRGSSWAPTTYMVLKGLERKGEIGLAYEIAERFLSQVVETFDKTGTLWENYMPEEAKPGIPAMPKFVGWTGLAPISVFFEFVLGIKANVPENVIIWDVNRTERHGIEKYPFGKDNTVDLICAERKSADEEPEVTVKSEKPVTVIVRWNGKEKTIGA